MEEKNNQHEDIIQNPEKGEAPNADNDTTIESKNEVSAEPSEENQEHKKGESI